MIEQCKVCQNREFDIKTGTKCKLTGEKPDFNIKCPDFVADADQIAKEEKYENRLYVDRDKLDEQNLKLTWGLIAAGVLIAIRVLIRVLN